MRTKDSYQEHMLGYLGGVQTEIELLGQSRIRRNALLELYHDLDIALERLWRLIGASDTDWEQFRFTLEASCDDLLRAIYRVLRSTGRLSEAELIKVHERNTQSEKHWRLFTSRSQYQRPQPIRH